MRKNVSHCNMAPDLRRHVSETDADSCFGGQCPTMKHPGIPLLLFLLVNPSSAEVFFHDTGRVRWEAEVTAHTFALREHRKGAAGSSEFVCPLGPAVRATAVRTSSDAGKVCLVFSKDKCAYKSGESAPGHPIAQPGAATFKCVDFATAEHANTLAALINAGPQPRRHAGSVRTPANSKVPAEAARPSRTALPAGAPQSGPPSPPRSKSGPPAFASGEADPAIAKLLARAQERAAVDPSSGTDVAAQDRTPASAIPMPNAQPSPPEGKPEASSVSRLVGGRGQ
jgi:hypothetical protein